MRERPTFRSVPHTSGLTRSRSGLTLGRAGFTLVEVMLVVTLVAILAATATPSVIRLMQDRSSQKDALSLLSVLQTAHSRAFGRGSAEIIRYTQAAPNAATVIRIQDSTQDVDGNGTGDIPNPLCNGILVEPRIFWQTSSKDRPTTVGLTTDTGAVVGVGSTQVLCFTPRGRTLKPSGAAWTPVTDVMTFSFTANDTGNIRFVHLFPNGIARLRI